jgi:tetratricopeptide (TPR) repeat protein
MEKPLKLKDETQAFIAEDETGSTSRDLQVGTGGLAAALPVQVIRDSAAEREAKKVADHEFLSAYKKHELYLRIRFGVITALAFILFAVGVPKFFACIDQVTGVTTHISPALAAALLGEKDSAYYKTSEFPLPLAADKVTGGVETRKKILDQSIKDIESNGQTAIFSRLGAEQLLFKGGARAAGLAYGNFLIDKYPTLPSNYCFRAAVDFGTGNFSDAISEYLKFAELLKSSPSNVKQAWTPEIARAYWACLDAGRVDEAKNFLKLFASYGGDASLAAELKPALPLALFDELDVPDLQRTKFWNAKLASYADRLMHQAYDDTSVLPDYLFDTDLAWFEVHIRANRIADATRIVRYFKRYGVFRYQTATAAKTALATGHPEQAVQVIKDSESQSAATPETDYLLSTALAKMNANDEAIRVADHGLALDTRNNLSSFNINHKYYLPLLVAKARALSNNSQFDSALAICNRVLEANPNMVAARLLKLDVFQKQHNNQAASDISSEISAHLKKLAP